MVPQLHFHHVVRYQNDVAWPKPVWGTPAVPYTSDVLAHMRQTLMLALRGQGDMPLIGAWIKSCNATYQCGNIEMWRIGCN